MLQGLGPVRVCSFAGLHADQLFSHSRDPHEASLVSLSQLTLGRPSAGDPRVSQLLWTGSKHVDSRVPTGPPTGTTAPRSAAYQVGMTTSMADLCSCSIGEEPHGW